MINIFVRNLDPTTTKTQLKDLFAAYGSVETATIVKEDYFFGRVDANRVQLSTGRDIALSPKQDGPAHQLLRLPVCRGRR